MAEKLYRYMPFEYFINMVQSSALFFADPMEDWDDGYEGYNYTRLISGNAAFCSSSVVEGINFQNFTQDIKNIKACCWCRKKDNVAMWYAYDYGNKAIMVEIDRDQLESISYSNLSGDSEKILVSDITYVPAEHLGEHIQDIFEIVQKGSAFRNCSRFLSIKRSEFDYESETRAFINVKDAGSINFLRDFIKDVVVHPKAKENYVAIVERFCEINNVNFSGKSRCLELRME